MKKIFLIVIIGVVILFAIVLIKGSESSYIALDPKEIKHLTIEDPVSQVDNSCMSVILPGDIGYWSEDFIVKPTYDVVRDAGIDIAHVYGDWGYIERSKSVYDWEYADQLIGGVYDRGMRVSLVLTPIGPGGPGVFPEDIEFTSFDDKELISRFESFMEELTSRYGKKISYLWIGNEVNTFLGKNRSVIDEYEEFYNAGYRIVKEVEPSIEVGLIGAYHDAVRNDELDIVTGFSNADILGVTLYPQLLEMTSDKLGVLLDDIDTLSSEINMPIAIVETAWSREGYGGSEVVHEKYIVDVLEKAKELPGNIGYICLVGPYDLPGSIIQFFGGNKLPKELQRWLLSLSFAKSNGEPHKSWSIFIDTMRKKGILQ